MWNRYHVWSIFLLFYIQYSAFSCITPYMRAWYKLCKIYPELIYLELLSFYLLLHSTTHTHIHFDSTYIEMDDAVNQIALHCNVVA